LLNGTYYYQGGNEGLNNVVTGLTSLTLALEGETESNLNTLCVIVDNQQAQLDELKTEVESLRKQIAQLNRSATRTTPHQ
jgi:hypothetical protein